MEGGEDDFSLNEFVIDFDVVVCGYKAGDSFLDEIILEGFEWRGGFCFEGVDEYEDIFRLKLGKDVFVEVRRCCEGVSFDPGDGRSFFDAVDVVSS